MLERYNFLNSSHRKWKTFNTFPVNPEEHYVVSREAELADFIKRVKLGRYIVIFAPRQTGKTTFFQWALDALAADITAEPTSQLKSILRCMKTIARPISTTHFIKAFMRRLNMFSRNADTCQSETLNRFLENTKLTDHVEMLRFFQQFANFLEDEKLVLVIDEFDGIPPDALRGFLHALRTIYVQRSMRKCPYSVGIVGVKSVTQLNLDRSISPFNIQDEFTLPNFTLEQVRELLTQYTDEVGQPFAPEVVESIHRQTAGQPFLVNRFAQILTEELDIPKTETLTMTHFSKAHAEILEERNTNLTHLVTNIRRDPRFKNILMEIVSYERGVRFSLRQEIISELATYGVIARGADDRCEIINPIYHYCILQTFRPIVNGLEKDYFPEDTGFPDYLTPTEQINMELLLDNFRDFIARVGFQICQVPETRKEFVGQDLLYAYLDQFVSLIRGVMCLEVQTGRGRMDLVISHNGQKYIVETKIWENHRRYEAAKKQLAAYLKLENVSEGYYVVFDHRAEPEPRVETETIDGLTIRSYVIPVIQEPPSQQTYGLRNLARFKN